MTNVEEKKNYHKNISNKREGKISKTTVENGNRREGREGREGNIKRQKLAIEEKGKYQINQEYSNRRKGKKQKNQ